MIDLEFGGDIMKSIISYLKKILILTTVNLVIVLLVYLIKNEFTLHNIGYGLCIGGVVMSIISGLAILGSGKTAQISVSNNYIRSSNNFAEDYMKERGKNMSFTLLMFLSGVFSLLIGYGVFLL